MCSSDLDDCQLACPWNKFAQRAQVPDFDVRPALNGPSLLALWRWDEPTFLRLTEGSPIRRIGHMRWRRNLAVAMGNALRTAATAPQAESGSADLKQALQDWLQAHGASTDPDAVLLGEHVRWALAQAGAVSC